MRVQTIEEFQILKGLDSKILSKISECAKQKTFQAGSRIIQEGESANAFYLIKSGKINVLAEKWRHYDAEEGTEFKAVQTLQAGDVLGWSWLVEPYTWGFNADVSENCEVFEVDGIALREFVQKDPALELQLIKRFVGLVRERLTATRMQLALYAGQPFVHCEGG